LKKSSQGILQEVKGERKALFDQLKQAQKITKKRSEVVKVDRQTQTDPDCEDTKIAPNNFYNSKEREIFESLSISKISLTETRDEFLSLDWDIAQKQGKCFEDIFCCSTMSCFFKLWAKVKFEKEFLLKRLVVSMNLKNGVYHISENLEDYDKKYSVAIICCVFQLISRQEFWNIRWESNSNPTEEIQIDSDELSNNSYNLLYINNFTIRDDPEFLEDDFFNSST